MARRVFQVIIVLVLGTLTAFTRDLLWLILGGLVLVYYELWMQTRLLEYLLREQQTMSTRQSQSLEQDADLVEEMAEPTEVAAVSEPGYELVEPQYVTATQLDGTPPETPEATDLPS